MMYYIILYHNIMINIMLCKTLTILKPRENEKAFLFYSKKRDIFGATLPFIPWNLEINYASYFEVQNLLLIIKEILHSATTTAVEFGAFQCTSASGEQS